MVKYSDLYILFLPQPGVFGIPRVLSRLRRSHIVAFDISAARSERATDGGIDTNFSACDM